jgi:tRNA(fMet)-specific endonuclease VapC
MTYLLNTNTCSYYLSGRALTVRQRLSTVLLKEVVVCSVVKAELYYGAMKSTDPA